MTANYRNPAKCKKCGSVLVCRCGQMHTTPSKFSDWIRKELNDSSSYDVENLDYIRFHYRHGWLITVEEKTFGMQPSEAQADTHNIVKQFLQLASGSRVSTLRGPRPIVYKGHFVISFEKETPDNSDWVKINGRKYSNPKAAIVFLFKFGQMLDESDIPTVDQEKHIAQWMLEKRPGGSL